MTWKSDLQESNSRLDFFMSLQDGTEPGLLAELEKQKTLIDEALGELKGKVTPHLPMEGQFVWKKYDKQPYTISFSVKPFTPSSNILISKSAQIDLTKVTASFFDGIGGDWTVTGAEKGSYEFTSGGTILKIFDGTNNFDFPCAYDPSTTEFSVTSSTGIGDVNSFSNYYNGAKFLGYITDDSETAFPDGGEKDGYFYELLPYSSKYGVFGTIDNDGLYIDAVIILPNIWYESFTASESYRNRGVFHKATNVLIDTEKIGTDCFSYQFSNLETKQKIKVKASELCSGAFSYSAESLFWLSNKLQKIVGSGYVQSPFYSSKNTSKIYCEAASQPSGFTNPYWQYYSSSEYLTTVWGVTEAEFDAL